MCVHSIHRPSSSSSPAFYSLMRKISFKFKTYYVILNKYCPIQSKTIVVENSRVFNCHTNCTRATRSPVNDVLYFYVHLRRRSNGILNYRYSFSDDVTVAIFNDARSPVKCYFSRHATFCLQTSRGTQNITFRFTRRIKTFCVIYSATSP